METRSKSFIHGKEPNDTRLSRESESQCGLKTFYISTELTSDDDDDSNGRRM